ncbi:hypothetical protein HRbin06_00575 [archaeon HR06]|nr:hypothetical protein HRbin06_00575 [archaeon HR06]
MINHTAEHIFMGSLIRILPNLKVVKVEHEKERNSLFVKGEELDWDKIYEAELMTNKIIQEGREVKIHYFDSLEEAKKVFPNLRAMEDRIIGKVRVVEVKDYDYSACNREHVKNSKECEFFLVESFTKSKDIYEIKFKAGFEAKLKALEYSRILMKSINLLEANLNTFERTCKNLKEENSKLKERIKRISEKTLNSLTFEEIRGIKFYKGIFEFLDRDIIFQRVNQMLREGEKGIILLINMEEEAFVILAGKIINCLDILKNAFKIYEGKGGGKKELANGVIKKEKILEFFNYVDDRVRKLISPEL